MRAGGASQDGRGKKGESSEEIKATLVPVQLGTESGRGGLWDRERDATRCWGKGVRRGLTPLKQDC